MAQDGKVVQLSGYRGGVEKVDQQLSNVVGNLRNRIGLQYASSDVILEPPVWGYEAFTQPDGSIRVGAEGKQEFSSLFCELGTDKIRINTLGMYVIYSALNSGIRDIRKKDPAAHVTFFELAETVTQYHDNFSNTDPHEVEEEISGWYAARLASRTVALMSRSEGIFGGTTELSQGRAALLGAQIQSQAIEALGSHESGISDGGGRHRVLGHFALSLKGIEGEVEQRINRILTAGK